MPVALDAVRRRRHKRGIVMRVRLRRVVCAVGVVIGMMPAVASGAGWSLMSSANVLVARGDLHGVSCVSAGACIAVGDSKNRAGTVVTLAERWNGRRWAIQATPNPTGAHTSSLFGVSCVSAGACTAVGKYKNSAGTFVTLAERWSGRRWAILATPNPTGAHDSSLFGVSCVSAGACTAVGAHTDHAGSFVTLAERWNGRRWAILATPNPTGAHGGGLNGVSCVSAGACTAVGNYTSRAGAEMTLAERWNGTR
jgi:hypothetical protein